MSSLNNQDKEILGLIKKDFTERNTQDNKSIFKLKENTIAELNTFKSDKEVINYLINRYKYEVYPIIKKIDEYPPLIQIEPSSICNFRCIFCFETDKTFTDKKSGHMGTMKLDLLKRS